MALTLAASEYLTGLDFWPARGGGGGGAAAAAACCCCCLLLLLLPVLMTVVACACVRVRAGALE